LLKLQHNPLDTILPLQKSSGFNIIPALAELLYILMFLHSGYPEMYTPILDILKSQNLHSPKEDYLRSRIAERAWILDSGKSGLFSNNIDDNLSS
jgi:hypothetical protein